MDETTTSGTGQRRFALLILSAFLGLSACSADSVDTGLVDPEPEEQQLDDQVGDQSDDDVTSTSTSSNPDPVNEAGVQPAVTGPGETVVGWANMGGEIVDPKTHPIDDVLVAESYPEQLTVSFTAGDEPCLAATATALASQTTVRIVLEAGITTDALTRSCLAGQFPHTLSIALSEGLDGRQLVIQQPGDPTAEDQQDTAPEPGTDDTTESTEPEMADGNDEPGPQAFESTLIGMSEQAAREATESAGYRWRVMSIDGEDLIGTADYDEGRVNVKLIDGVVTEAWLG